MNSLLTKYDQLKHNKCQIYIKILQIINTYRETPSTRHYLNVHFV